MDGLADLFKQIGQIDSTLKLIAFLASILVIIVLALLKRNTDLPKNMMNILLTLFAMVFCLALVAMFIHAEKPPPQQPATYSLTITLTDSTNNAFPSDKTEVVLNNNLASKGSAPPGSDAWTFTFGAGELSKERAVLISAHTKDSVYFGNKWDTLTYEANQSVTVLLHRVTPIITVPPAPHTFSMNLSDPGLRKRIAQITNLTYDPNSRVNKIVITYDKNSIAPDNQGISSMTPAHPIVLIDGQRFVLEGCTVQPPDFNNTRHPEQLISYAKQQSIELATSYLQKNPNVLAQWLRSMQR